MSRGRQQCICAERHGGTDDRADIMRIRHLVERQDQLCAAELVHRRRFERLGLDQHALMHGILTDALVDPTHGDFFRLDRKCDAALFEACTGIARRIDRVHAAARIGERQFNRVHAIEKDAAFRRAGAGTTALPLQDLRRRWPFPRPRPAWRLRLPRRTRRIGGIGVLARPLLGTARTLGSPGGVKWLVFIGAAIVFHR